MKKIISLLCALLLLALALGALCACSKEDGGGGIFDKDKKLTDEYGFERPASGWLTECLILPEYPSPEEVFGAGGESGLASDWALEQDGRSASYGIYYLVCLVYGTPTAGSRIDSYLKFSFVSGTSVLYDEGCVSLSNTNDQIDAFGDLEATLDMSLPADERLQVSLASENEKDYVQGMLVIRFSVDESEMQGDLHVDMSLDTNGVSGTRKLDTQELLSIGGGDSYGKIGAQVSDLSVRYISQSAYNGGSYEESAIVGTASFEKGEYCYMVLDFTITAVQQNEGTGSLRVMTYVPERNKMAATIEEAPTGKIEESVQDGVTTIYAVYGVPMNAGEKKTVRMLLRLLSVSGGEVELDLFITGGEGTALSGQTHVSKTVDTGEPTLEYALNSDGKSYEVVGMLSEELTAINIPDKLGDGLPVTKIKADIFTKNTKITHLSIGNYVTEIPGKAFQGCTALRSAEIGDGAAYIGAEAFSGCSALASVTLGSGVESVGKKAFLDCKKLTAIALGDALTYIGEVAFSGCSSLGELTLGSGLKTIKAGAFTSCVALKSVVLPDSVTTVEKNAFQGCTALESMTMGRGASFGEAMLQGCSGLKSLTLAYTNKSVCLGHLFGTTSYTGSVAATQPYSSSSRTYHFPEGLSTLVITSGEIPKSAFKGCTMLKTVRVEREVSKVGNAAFDGCTGLTSFYMGSDGFYGGYTNDTFFKAGTAGEGFSLTIGPAVKYIPMALFGLSASAEGFFPKLLSVEFEQGSTCTEIGDYAFSHARLFTIQLPQTVEVIGEGAFRYSELQEIALPQSLTQMDQYAFANCQSLGEIVIPDKVKGIAQSAFSGCSGLKRVTIGKGVEYVAKGAFYGCYKLEELYLNATNLSSWGMTIGGTPDLPFESAGISGSGFTLYVGANVTHLPEYMFYSDEPGNQGQPPKLTRVVFAEGSVCKSIGQYAFYRCDRLAEIVLPDSMESIGAGVFAGCTALESLHYSGTVAQWGAITKASGWLSNPNVTQVICSDDTVTP